MIIFEANPSPGYSERTRVNVMCATITVAIATDFDSAGEILTRNFCSDRGKRYVAIQFSSATPSRADVLNVSNAIATHSRFPGSASINIAGNGIHTLKSSSKYKGEHIQKLCDGFTLQLLRRVTEEIKGTDYSISMIRSGGQTGFDEAGLKAGKTLGLMTLCHAPADWRFRNYEGRDISDEYEFKKRFIGCG